MASLPLSHDSKSEATGLGAAKIALQRGVQARSSRAVIQPVGKQIWTLEDCIESVILPHGLKLVGWLLDIPSQNLSIRDGATVHTYLKHYWDMGILEFVRITEDKCLAASLSAEHLDPAPHCAHRKCPGGREDIGHGRYRYKTNPYGCPLRRPKTGPKTPKYAPAEWDN
ncbi:hypothetical protein GSI_07803 [Ganoderma sinense ZZ0214-1]|uniref:Uncharacterized protein n=1 Tax=Ganoderma sinense ZZ0214-1 TaxID=1077348 RepID=A0A2G8S8F6_9APHY|nr:hypothetical protein GSI_07630 [Ganoderma sinense ZZ0214-1]PIL30225.1 hypothetical protein GSI_07803 [Ganoderma sinense ZZ0214-1]